MEKTEREETTDYAKKKVNKFLKNKEYISALLLTSIYMNIRLKTLLTNRLSPAKEKWKETSNSVDSIYGGNKMCEPL